MAGLSLVGDDPFVDQPPPQPPLPESWPVAGHVAVCDT